MIGNDKQQEKPSFDPPYSLRGQVGLLFCLSPETAWLRAQIASASSDLKLLKLVSTVPAVVVCSHWDPHPEHPSPYDEVIISCFALKGFKIYSVPLVLHLNDDFHVRLGIEHYHLPKILTPSLQTELTPEAFTVSAEGVSIRQEFLAPLLQILLFPVSFAVALLVSIGTNIIRLVGISGHPLISARISLMPCLSFGRFTRMTRFMPGIPADLRPVFSMFWPKTYTVISAPNTL